MAGSDPTQTGDVLCIDVPARERNFLHELITLTLDGVRDELSNEPGNPRKRAELRREEAAYEHLLAGLRSGRVRARPDFHPVLMELGQVVDASNEYERVVFEHEALQGLIAAVDPARRSPT